MNNSKCYRDIEELATSMGCVITLKDDNLHIWLPKRVMRIKATHVNIHIVERILLAYRKVALTVPVLSDVAAFYELLPPDEALDKLLFLCIVERLKPDDLAAVFQAAGINLEDLLQ